MYRRRIRLEAGDGFVRGDMEDDPHRFGVIVRHDGERVTGIEGIPLRTPWDMCHGAVAQLQLIVGAPLSLDPQSLHRLLPAAPTWINYKKQFNRSCRRVVGLLCRYHDDEGGAA